jgi:hypothetical protein
MSENDATVAAVLFLLFMMVRKVDWRVDPFSDSDDDIEAAEFLESVLEDMDTPWEDVLMDIISMFVFGFSLLEIVYKRRLGPENEDRKSRSAYNDGLIGWRKLAGRSQESIAQWVFDEDQEVLGAWQWPPLSGNRVFLPREKLMHFRTGNYKNNPEGRSILRGAYTSYYRKTNLERIEAIGVERDLAGFPVMYVDPDILADDASPDMKRTAAMYKKILKNIRIDQQAGVILPSEFNEKGERVTDLKLLSTGSRRQNNTDGIIKRYAQNIASVIIADFILIGHEAVGSYALAEQKYDMFNVALGGWLDSVAEQFNRDGIRKLFEINGFPTDRLPKLVPGQPEKQNLSEISLSLMQLVNAGMIQPGGIADENFIRKLAGMPLRTDIPPTPDTSESPTKENYLSHPDYTTPMPGQEDGAGNQKPPNPAGQSQGSGATPTGKK